LLDSYYTDTDTYTHGHTHTHTAFRSLYMATKAIGNYFNDANVTRLRRNTVPRVDELI